jgi:hypothetical protein
MALFWTVAQFVPRHLGVHSIVRVERPDYQGCFTDRCRSVASGRVVRTEARAIDATARDKGEPFLKMGL